MGTTRHLHQPNVDYRDRGLLDLTHQANLHRKDKGLLLPPPQLWLQQLILLNQGLLRRRNLKQCRIITKIRQHKFKLNNHKPVPHIMETMTPMQPHQMTLICILERIQECRTLAHPIQLLTCHAATQG